MLWKTGTSFQLEDTIGQLSLWLNVGILSSAMGIKQHYQEFQVFTKLMLKTEHYLFQYTNFCN